MSALAQRDPKYRHYKPKDLAVVRIDGRDHYLGKYGSPESWEKYHRLLAERYGHPGWPDSGQPGTKPQAESLTITELIRGYDPHCERYYVKNGKATNQVRMIRLSLQVLQSLYGSPLVRDLGPLKLEACQSEFVRQGLSRGECHRRTNLIKQAFRWAASKELAPKGIYHELLAVSGLKKGRCEAREPAPVGPVPEAIVERTMEHLCPTVAAMVRIQFLAGMRPGELVVMRARDLVMSGTEWEFRPGSHQGEHHDKDRVIFLGPRAQEIIRPFLSLDISGYLFSPKRALEEQTAERRAERKTPLWPSHEEHQAKKRERRGRRPTHDRYDVNAYRRAIARACNRAFPHPELSAIPRPRKKLTSEQRADLKAWQKAHQWHPHQLRPAQATAIRKRFGAEAAQAVLGHAELNTTEIYAQRSLDAARQVLREIG